MAETDQVLFDGPADAPMTIALAHGAGAPMDAPFMETIVAGLAGHGLRVARFEFPYMAKRRADGAKKLPDRAPVLLQSWREMIDRLGRDRLVVGGKSMGGRIASMVAAALQAEGAPVRGVVCLGYPFHPPGKPERLRTEHLETIKTPTLILQGERDPFGRREEVEGYTLSKAVRLHWLPDGDHGLKPRKASGHSEAENLTDAVTALARFVAAL
ncbi:MAG TPA: alpha/beta family hydrolase [Alphaproteobacteria bacterium]|nr:alpha/beta family hydrolase [Alphaproteobacteria bacterium]